MSRSVFTEEGRTRLRNFHSRLRRYLLAGAAIGALLGGFHWWFWVCGDFRPREKIYFPAYIVAMLKTWLLPDTNRGNYTMLSYNLPGERCRINLRPSGLRKLEGRPSEDKIEHYQQVVRAIWNEATH
jgi:hypothetical protein